MLWSFNDSGMSHWIIYSIDSLRTLDSFRNESLNHILNWFTQNTWFIQEWVIESYTQLIRSEHLIHSGMSHWIIYSIDSLRTLDSFRNVCKWVTECPQPICSNTLCSKTGLFRNKRSYFFRVIHWIINFLTQNTSFTESYTVRFIQKHWFTQFCVAQVRRSTIGTIFISNWNIVSKM